MIKRGDEKAQPQAEKTDNNYFTLILFNFDLYSIEKKS